MNTKNNVIAFKNKQRCEGLLTFANECQSSSKHFSFCTWMISKLLLYTCAAWIMSSHVYKRSWVGVCYTVAMPLDRNVVRCGSGISSHVVMTRSQRPGNKWERACTCVPPWVCAGLEGQTPRETAFLSESLIKLLYWEQRLSSLPSF